MRHSDLVTPKEYLPKLLVSPLRIASILVKKFICLDFKEGFPTNLFQRETNNLDVSVTDDLEVNSPEISLGQCCSFFQPL